MQTFVQSVRSVSPQVLLVHHTMAEQATTLHFPGGILMNAAYFNHFSKQFERTVQVRLRGPVTITLTKAERFPGWCYLQQWSNEQQHYYCSCYDHRRDSVCEHVQALEKLDSLLG